MSVSLEDGTIYARSEAKVIGVNDQTAHRVSLAGRKKGAMQRECLSSEFGGEHPSPTAEPNRLTVFSRVAYTRSGAIRAHPLRRVPNGQRLPCAALKGFDLANIAGAVSSVG